MTSATDSPAPPGIFRRVATAAYEGLLLLAIMFVFAFIFLAIFGTAQAGLRRHIFQAYLLMIVSGYFTWFWVHGGQTLAMKTWHIRLVTVENGYIPVKVALLRFVLATAGLAFFGAGWWWMLFDRENCTLHDRLAGTRLVVN